MGYSFLGNPELWGVKLESMKDIFRDDNGNSASGAGVFLAEEIERFGERPGNPIIAVIRAFLKNRKDHTVKISAFYWSELYFMVDKRESREAISAFFNKYGKLFSDPETWNLPREKWDILAEKVDSNDDVDLNSLEEEDFNF